MIPADIRTRLDALAKSWPTGSRVRHTAHGWTGRVVVAAPGAAPGVALTDSAAHAVAGTVSIVHLQPEESTGLPPMWVNVRYLAPAAPVVSPRAVRTTTTRTRRRT
ncbi:hypothetical protein [Actinomadura macra]|uniref:hypothetical protein n=1 Tax=Actinomadura macra TaxID=46164 RepID=UPI0008324185|nr:hypothetical protein [Actinomadura macra]